MLTGETKRILIEELGGYSRRDVNRMRVELAGPILEKRIRPVRRCRRNGWILT